MCNPELIHPIPQPPLSIILLGTSGFVLHPTIQSEQELHEHRTWSKLRDSVTNVTEWNFVSSSIVDERTTLRSILSILYHTLNL